MTRILEREGERLEGLRDRFRAAADAGFLAVSSLIEGWARAARLELDPQAAAAVLVGAVVNFRRSAWTLGRRPSASTTTASSRASATSPPPSSEPRDFAERRAPFARADADAVCYGSERDDLPLPLAAGRVAA
jgi:hypothetical protein